jgi:HSP20 family molecular chaperone IbpA
MVEEKVPITRWAWSNVTGNISCDEKKCTITVHLPKAIRENIAFEVTNETFCLKGTKKDGSPLEYFGCWILAHSVDPKKAKANFKDNVLTVSVPLMKASEVTKVKID